VIIRDSVKDVLARYRTSEYAQKPTLEALEKGSARAIPSALVDMDDDRITDKWGPAGCFETKSHESFPFLPSGSDTKSCFSEQNQPIGSGNHPDRYCAAEVVRPKPQRRFGRGNGGSSSGFTVRASALDKFTYCELT
jgi:hypothetical protein